MGIKSQMGKRLRTLRRNKNANQKDVADVLGISQTAYGKIESGQRGLSSEYCIKLADFYGVTCDYILRGIESENVDICAKTGLKQDSIDWLIKAKIELEKAKSGIFRSVKGGVCVDQEVVVSDYSAREYIINSFIQYVCRNDDGISSAAIQGAKSTFEYLFDCSSAKQRLKKNSFIKKDLIVANYEASESFATFFHFLLRDSEFYRQVYLRTDAETLEEVLSYAIDEKLLDKKEI